jgi:hypothetical protein
MYRDDYPLAGLEGFRDQLAAQIAVAGPPRHENALHHCLALGFQAAFDLVPGDIIFERPSGPGNVDLWFCPWDIAVEVKYHRPVPSQRNRPFTQHFGQLLADLSKLAQTEARMRLALLVADAPAVHYLEHSGRGLLPLVLGGRVQVDAAAIAALPGTAAGNAQSYGPWRPLDVRLRWQAELQGYRAYAWELVVASPG